MVHDIWFRYIYLHGQFVARHPSFAQNNNSSEAGVDLEVGWNITRNITRITLSDDVHGADGKLGMDSGGSV